LFGDAERLLATSLPVHITAVDHSVIAHFKERDG
jgi:hypothetical protein